MTNHAGRTVLLAWLACAGPVAAAGCAPPPPVHAPTRPAIATAGCTVAPLGRDAFRDRVALVRTQRGVAVRVEHAFGIDAAVLRCAQLPGSIDVELGGFTGLEGFAASARLADGSVRRLPVVKRGRGEHVSASDDPLDGTVRIDVIEPFGATIDASSVPSGAAVHISWVDWYRL